MIEYIAPYYKIEIGSKEIKKIHSLEVISSRVTPVDIAEIEIPYVKHDFQTGQEIIISQGYKSKGIWQLFKGTIKNISNKSKVKFFCKDYMDKLRDIKINKSFIDCTPQEILKYSLGKAGVNYILTSKSFRKKHHFIVRNKDVITMVKLINQTWELEYDFYFDDETFYWGPWEESPRYSENQIVKFTYGKNIIDLDPNKNGVGSLKSISLPFIKHSNVIKIIDQRYWDKEVLVKVDRIKTTFRDNKGRCEIEWQVLKN